jgi:hypothetical protein
VLVAGLFGEIEELMVERLGGVGDGFLPCVVLLVLAVEEGLHKLLVTFFDKSSLLEIVVVKLQLSSWHQGFRLV